LLQEEKKLLELISQMHFVRVALWGFAATVVLSVTLMASMALGLTRMDMSFMMGTIFTADRDRAKWLGFVMHFIVGWVFAVVYIALIHDAGLFHWWFGMLIGFIHALFLLLVVMSVLPSLHPRMATETRGPDPTRQLEPPGFLGLHYGRGTPLTTIVAHLFYGGILGLFYR
jgi:hypothetical protein